MKLKTTATERAEWRQEVKARMVIDGVVIQTDGDTALEVVDDCTALLGLLRDMKALGIYAGPGNEIWKRLAAALEDE